MVDRWEGRLVDRRVGLKADHSGVLMEVRLADLKVDHSADLMEGLKAVQKGLAVTMVASLLSGRLVLLEPVQVVQLVVKEEAMEQAQIGPALVELVSTNQQQAEQLVRLQLALRAADRELE
jgi:hypothetical protein